MALLRTVKYGTACETGNGYVSQEILSYNNEKIRHILIPQEYNFHAPQEELSATGWKTLTQENVMDFSALAYFFAKEMYERPAYQWGSSTPAGEVLP